MSFSSSYLAFERAVKRGDQSVQNWLYGSYDEQKLNHFTALYSVPGVRQYFDYLLDKRADQEYLRRYDMSYSDIHDPRKLRQVGSGSSMISHSYNMVSKNIHRLYK